MHELAQECLILFLRLLALVLLLSHLILDESEKVTLRYVFEISALLRKTLAHEPLVNFFESVLSALLICHIVAEGRLLIELGQ